MDQDRFIGPYSKFLNYMYMSGSHYAHLLVVDTEKEVITKSLQLVAG